MDVEVDARAEYVDAQSVRGVHFGFGGGGDQGAVDAAGQAEFDGGGLDESGESVGSCVGGRVGSERLHEVLHIFLQGRVALFDAAWRDAGDALESFFGEGEGRSEEHTSELQSRGHLVCRLLLEKK